MRPLAWPLISPRGTMSMTFGSRQAPHRRTFVDLVRERASQHATRVAFRYLKDGEIEEASTTYGSLDRRARAIAAKLQEECTGGQRALIFCEGCLNYISSILGCLYAGVAAVPCSPRGLRRGIEAISSIVTDCRPALYLGDGDLDRQRQLLSAATPLTRGDWVNTDAISDEFAMEWREPRIDPSTIALVQYTSGSTSRPKGVVVTHDNLLANEQMIQQAFGQTEESVIVGWLPLHHDMGLIGNVLQTLYSGATAVLMSPGAFLTKPLRWLSAISNYRATTSGGPDFAYRLCVEKSSSSASDFLDLSSWTLAFNGSEPIRQETLNMFADAFHSSGFSNKAFLPCYGLAEATLFVAGSKTSETLMARALDGAKLRNGIVALSAGAEKGTTIVCCGFPAERVRIAIVNPATKRRCATNEIGEIWVSGENVAKEYFNARRLSRQCLRARIKDEWAPEYLRTGDLGFLHSGCLYVTGRIKDTIIVRGQNHYPQDLERTVANVHPEFRELSGAAFAVESNESSAPEDVIVVQEVRRRTVLEFDKLAGEVRAAISAGHGLHLRGVVFAKR